jgi:hypothetical protein
MAHDLTSTQARAVSLTDLVIYDEIDFIHRAVMTDALLGEISVQVLDGTTMTESTPAITVTSSGAGAFTPSETIILAGTTITLGDGGTDGTGVEQAIADINNASVTGLTASQSGSEIVLTYQPLQTAWTLTLAEGSGTALIDLGFTVESVTAVTPESVSYYNMWTGTIDDRKKSYEFERVVTHFQGLGYSIIAKLNTSTTNTFFWEIYW